MHATAIDPFPTAGSKNVDLEPIPPGFDAHTAFDECCGDLVPFMDWDKFIWQKLYGSLDGVASFESSGTNGDEKQTPTRERTRSRFFSKRTQGKSKAKRAPPPAGEDV